VRQVELKTTGRLKEDNGGSLDTMGCAQMDTHRRDLAVPLARILAPAAQLSLIIWSFELFRL
jgi:hypothetical protein